jgi:orotidine-5'-phosphate decarboxylase
MAFYEKYGSYGVAAFEKTVKYAKAKGLVVIEDAKRGDIGNTARAYADGHLGEVETLDGSLVQSYGVDFLTINPFLGSESLKPFLEVCNKFGKGIFVLVKTSNSSSAEIQDVVTKKGITVSQTVAEYVNNQAQINVGQYGYSPIGAVVGATYPAEATKLRKQMPKSYFLVPGYGAQGGSAEDILPCFNTDGLGAIINSSRALLYSHMTDDERMRSSREDYLKSVRSSVVAMKNDIYRELKSHYPHMRY